MIVNGEFDLWELFPDGAKPKKLTDGAAEQVRHRYVNPEAPATGGRGGRGGGSSEPIDLAKPVYVSVNGIWTKKNGYAALERRQGGAHGVAGSQCQPAGEGEGRRCLRV